MSKSIKNLIAIFILVLVCIYIVVPKEVPSFEIAGRTIVPPTYELKKGLDIQGGMQVVLQANMDEIAEVDREEAINSSQAVIKRRVDLYGISEPLVQTARVGDDYRLIVELPGLDDPDQALELVGKTAQLDFRLQGSPPAIDLEATDSADFAELSALAFLDSFEETQLGGKQLKRAAVDFNQQTNEPVIRLEFDAEGTELFADITSDNVNKVLGIFMDGQPVVLPSITTPILDGQAIMSGGYEIEEAKQLAIQLNAGALPVPITVLEQRQIGASLGEISVQKSIRAGVVGLALVMLFMILYYGLKGVIASVALLIYALITLAVYKVLGVTLTLPGVAGLLLSIGMAVDANILIFERMKEELRVGNPYDRALELGFGRAWDSIKDANLATIMTALVLINPMDFSFLSSSGLVRGFGITLLIGVLISLFTGVFVTRTLMRVFLPLLARSGGADVSRKAGDKK